MSLLHSTGLTAMRVLRHRIAQLCLDLADELAVLLIELDPDLPVTGAPRRNTR